MAGSIAEKRFSIRSMKLTMRQLISCVRVRVTTSLCWLFIVRVACWHSFFPLDFRLVAFNRALISRDNMRLPLKTDTGLKVFPEGRVQTLIDLSRPFLSSHLFHQTNATRSDRPALRKLPTSLLRYDKILLC